MDEAKVRELILDAVAKARVAGAPEFFEQRVLAILNAGSLTPERLNELGTICELQGVAMVEKGLGLRK